MDDLLKALALAAVIVGTAFSLIGVLGFVRLPDVYARLHAAGKVSVFGAALLTIAAVALTSLNTGKALLLIALLIIAGPAVSHALASAAYRLGLPMRGAVRNDLIASTSTTPDTDTPLSPE